MHLSVDRVLRGRTGLQYLPPDLSLAALFNRLDPTPIPKSQTELAFLTGKQVLRPSAGKVGDGAKRPQSAESKSGLQVGLPELPFLQQLYKADIEDLHASLEKLSSSFCKWIRSPVETHCVSGDFEGVVARSLYSKGPPLITYSNHTVFGPSETVSVSACRLLTFEEQSILRRHH